MDDLYPRPITDILPEHIRRQMRDAVVFDNSPLTLVEDGDEIAEAYFEKTDEHRQERMKAMTQPAKGFVTQDVSSRRKERMREAMLRRLRQEECAEEEGLRYSFKTTSHDMGLREAGRREASGHSPQVGLIGAEALDAKSPDDSPEFNRTELLIENTRFLHRSINQLADGYFRNHRSVDEEFPIF